MEVSTLNFDVPLKKKKELKRNVRKESQLLTGPVKHASLCIQGFALCELSHLYYPVSIYPIFREPAGVLDEIENNGCISLFFGRSV